MKLIAAYIINSPYVLQKAIDVSGQLLGTDTFTGFEMPLAEYLEASMSPGIRVLAIEVDKGSRVHG